MLLDALELSKYTLTAVELSRQCQMDDCGILMKVSELNSVSINKTAAGPTCGPSHHMHGSQEHLPHHLPFLALLWKTVPLKSQEGVCLFLAQLVWVELLCEAYGLKQGLSGSRPIEVIFLQVTN